MRLPRLHPADVPAAIGTAGAVLAVGSWCAWTTYQAAQSWTPTAAEHVAMGGVAGAAGAAVTVFGLVCARAAGAQHARRVMNDHRAAQSRYRAEAYIGRRRAAVGGHAPGGWSEVNALPAAADARRALDNAAARRFELPVGSRGTATAAARLAEQHQGGVDLAELGEVDQGGETAG